MQYYPSGIKNTIINFIFILMVMATLLKPPFENTVENALIQASSGIIGLILMLSSRVKLKIYILLLSCLLPLIHQTVFQSITAAYFQLFIVFFAIWASTSPLPMFKITKSTIIISLLATIATFASFHETHTGRYSTFNGDPNYTSLLINTVTLLIYSISTTKAQKSFLILILITTAVATQSRNGILAILAYFICCHIKYHKKLFTYFVLLWSIAAIPLSITLFASSISEGSAEKRTLTTVIDGSNLERVVTYFKAVEFIQDNFSEFIFNGVRYYIERNPSAENIPHNWFIQIILGSGLLLTTAYTLSIIALIKICDLHKKIALPMISFLLVYAGILSIYPLTTPLLLVFIFFTASSKHENSIYHYRSRNGRGRKSSLQLSQPPLKERV